MANELRRDIFGRPMTPEVEREIREDAAATLAQTLPHADKLVSVIEQLPAKRSWALLKEMAASAWGRQILHAAAMQRLAVSDAPLAMVLSRVHKGTGHAPVPDGNGRWIARCPFHAENVALRIGKGRLGQVQLKCSSGCHVLNLLALLGLRIRDLWPKD